MEAELLDSSFCITQNFLFTPTIFFKKMLFIFVIGMTITKKFHEEIKIY